MEDLQTQETQEQGTSVEELEVVSLSELLKPAETPSSEEPANPTPEPAATTVTAEPAPAAPESTPAPEIATPKIEYAPPPQKELTAEELVQRFEDKTALLKQLGLDDFLIGALDYYKAQGDLTPYLEAKTVDFAKMPEQQIVERKLREKYASLGLAEDKVNKLVQHDLIQTYKQDEATFSETDVELGRLRMEADAALYRKEFMERQQKFAAPPKQPQEQVQEPSHEELIEATKQRVLAEPLVQEFVKKPLLKIGDDELSFNYEAKNVNAALGVLVDPAQMTFYTSKKDEMGRILTDVNGNPVPDYSFLLELAAHITDRQNYNTLLMKHGKSLGTKQIAEQLNPEAPSGQAVVPDSAPVNTMQALADALRQEHG
ncbi:hypothetical protein PDL71_15440 [Lacibacter sp. MH-610]|uniref:hypothetical protein n=1 Tax=Lacibacter sp. MH-610 TaxID=3020883 RepID=UPI0038920343